METKKLSELKYSFLLKLTEDDRTKLSELQESGINVSQFLRLQIREIHKKNFK